jgi:hypothetical protein
VSTRTATTSDGGIGMMVRIRLATAVAAAGMLAVGVAGAAATGDRGGRSPDRFVASLNGYEEVPPVSTEGRGSFRARLTEDGIAWTLRYSAVEGGAVQQAHIHFGQRAVNGGVSAFLCSSLPNAPAGVQACPNGSARLRGTIRAGDVVGPATQGIAPGELRELVRAMRAGVTYANVHSTTYPAGEIRGQVHRR